MEFTIISQKLCHSRIRRSILVLGMLTCAVLVFHTFTLPLTNISPPAFPTTKIAALWKRNAQSNGSASGLLRVGEFSLLSDSRNSTSEGLKEIVDTEASGSEGDVKKMQEIEDSQANDIDVDDGSDLDEDTDPDKEFSFDFGDGFILKKVRDPIGGFITLVKVKESEGGSSTEKVVGTGEGYGTSRTAVVLDDVGQPDININSSNDGFMSLPHASNPLISSYEDQDRQVVNSSGLVLSASSNVSSLDKLAIKTLPRDASSEPAPINLTTSKSNSSMPAKYPIRKRKKWKPIKSISQMNSELLRNRASYRTLSPRWSSACDQKVIAIKSQIDHSPVVKNDQELHAPAFRNISMFKRSYELMERTLKVYVYKEGQKPIFHQPLLKGIYASEGWFMKVMEGNRHFVVKNPRKAHLFYIPFSSRFLEFSLYVPNSHNRTNLRQFLKNYVDTIAAKYPFWNRTGGTDHFVVACHDWAPYETRHTMDRTIRALCNADLSSEFRLGKDVSLPETYVRFGRDPLRDLGGKPANKRNILAFYAGNMHGYLRSILLEHWENKDPDMKIWGPMPPGVKSKMNYIQHMKSSKYCICPRGYEVNSPRVVEAIFYECVPVIISDNYVLPFFEVMNWEAFSVIIAEADVPRLKEILVSIPEERYLSLQMGVRKVQKHFLWHAKPVKYDLFHMILHSIWYNRVYTIRPK